jgi:hypothetical protein
VSISVLDHHRFKERGAYDCGNSHFVLKAVTCCGRQCVEDEELTELFIDPFDLSKTFSLHLSSPYEQLPCPFCGSVEWDLVLIDDVLAIAPEWKWAARIQ